MRTYFVLNLLLAMLWPILLQVNALADFLAGFVVGLLLLSFVEPEYGRRGVRLPLLVLLLAWEIVVSNLVVAAHLLRPRMKVRQGLVAVPLELSRPLEIALLASMITLTPGTLSVDLGWGADGRRVLFVHSVLYESAEALRAGIQDGFERRILEITRGGRQ